MAAERNVVIKVNADPQGLEQVRAAMSRLADEAKRAGDGTKQLKDEVGKIPTATAAVNPLTKMLQGFGGGKGAEQMALAALVRNVPGLGPGLSAGMQAGAVAQAGGGMLAEAGGLLGGGAGGAIAGVGKALAGAAGPIGAVVAAVATAAHAFVSAVRGVANEMTRMVGVFSPGHVERLNLAFSSISATIGRSLTPVVEAMTEAWRGVAEIIANLMPDATEFRLVLDPVREAFKELKDAARDVAPVVRELVAENIRAFAIGVRHLTETFRPLLTLMKVGMGMNFLVGSADRSAALPGGQAKYLGLEDVGREAAMAALRMGQQDAPERTADATEQILDLLSPAVQRYLGGAVEGAAAAVDPLGVSAALRGWLLGGT